MDTLELAKRIRIHVLKMTSQGGSAHVGSSFSIADLLAVLYGKILHSDPERPDLPDRDRFILSKGHAGAAVYAALAERGYFSTSQLQMHCQNGSYLSGHISHKGIPGVEISTGSLGHGLSIGCGMAYNGKLENQGHRVFVLLSDGECDEGSNWEAILFAGHHKLENLVAIIDYNKLQSLNSVSDTLNLEPLAEKWRSFGWGAVEVDGHNHTQVFDVLSGIPAQKGKPTCVIAHTIKGKGVSFMEGSVLWHYRTARGPEFELALKELEALP